MAEFLLASAEFSHTLQVQSQPFIFSRVFPDSSLYKPKEDRPNPEVSIASVNTTQHQCFSTLSSLTCACVSVSMEIFSEN